MRKWLKRLFSGKKSTRKAVHDKIDIVKPAKKKTVRKGKK